MARTNLENIIPIYRIGDGYVIAKDGSVTVGFILTLPEYDTLSKADFRDDGSGDGMRLYTQLEAAIKDLDEGYTFHQQDIIYYAPQDLPHYDNYLSKTVNRMYNGKRWLSSKSYIFITKQKSISIQSDYSDEAIDKIVSVIKRFRAALSQFSPRRIVPAWRRSPGDILTSPCRPCRDDAPSTSRFKIKNSETTRWPASQFSQIRTSNHFGIK